MRLLLDTHVVLWAAHEPHRLSSEAIDRIRRHPSVVSVATHWEIAVKQSKGKLPADDRLAEWLEGVGVELLPISLAHVAALARLPQHHRDPFDRMLIAQSQVEGLTIVTSDRAFQAYDVGLIGA